MRDRNVEDDEEKPRRRRVPTRRGRDHYQGDVELGDWAEVPAENAEHWDARLWRDRPIR